MDTGLLLLDWFSGCSWQPTAHRSCSGGSAVMAWPAAGMFESLGFRPGRLFAAAAGLAEVGAACSWRSGCSVRSVLPDALGDDCGAAACIGTMVCSRCRMGSSCRCSTARSPRLWPSPVRALFAGCAARPDVPLDASFHPGAFGPRRLRRRESGAGRRLPARRPWHCVTGPRPSEGEHTMSVRPVKTGVQAKPRSKARV